MNGFILKKAPFDIGVFNKKSSHLPERLPFVLNFDSKSGEIKQKIGKKNRIALKKYYLSGGYASTPLGEGEYGKRQGLEVFKSLLLALKDKSKRLENMSFLEIGASYGYLLYLLKKQKAKEVVGIEPGREGIIGSKKYGIKMIRKFFPFKLKQKFDCIYNYCVLEHVEKPLIFLKNIYKNLNNEGMIFVAVPDCEKKMGIGDLSIITHQHLNYYTQASLRRLIEGAGFVGIRVETFKQTSTLVAWGIKSVDNNISLRFMKNFKKNIDSIQKMVNDFESKKMKIGLYAPGSFLRCLIKFGEEPRIFNGDIFKQNKYITGSKLPIEAPAKLISNPVDVLFIAPIDYDEEIKAALIKSGLNRYRTLLVSLKDMYEKNSGINYDLQE
ncbi:MAG: class I SAM-dependent methyltransferase [Candidatus Paceibacterota bacterium]|jgi:2-polyprenyl-3-methyl-5-hydroxy-6-metoxy-1,4-benzoquinol methylase